jgi:hypothetical protein
MSSVNFMNFIPTKLKFPVVESTCHDEHILSGKYLPRYAGERTLRYFLFLEIGRALPLATAVSSGDRT